MHDPISILLADPVHPNNQHKTFPYAAGCVGAYAAAQLGDARRVEVFRTPEDLGAAFRARTAGVLGFTNYVWNLELSYEVIRQAKAAAPHTVGRHRRSELPDRRRTASAPSSSAIR